MYRECRHILPTGRKCKCPAVTGQLRCHFHSTMRHHSEDGLSDRKEPLILPSLEDVAGIQIALMQVTSALGSGRITNKQAGLYLYALQIASTLAARAEKMQPVKDAVRSVTCDDRGNILAEEVTVCEPPHDCLHCQNRPTCDKFEDYQDEVEELEEQLEEEEDEDETEDEEEDDECDGEDEDDEEDEDDSDEEVEDEESILDDLQAQASNQPRTLTTQPEVPRRGRSIVAHGGSPGIRQQAKPASRRAARIHSQPLSRVGCPIQAAFTFGIRSEKRTRGLGGKHRTRKTPGLSF